MLNNSQLVERVREAFSHIEQHKRQLILVPSEDRDRITCSYKRVEEHVVRVTRIYKDTGEKVPYLADFNLMLVPPN